MEKTPLNPFFKINFIGNEVLKKVKTKKKKRVWLFWIKIKLCLLGGKIMIT